MAGGDYNLLNMAKETWIEVRVIVPARMQEEASLFLTDFSGRGVIIEEENVPAGGVVIRAYFRPEEYGDWQRQELQDYLKRLSVTNSLPWVWRSARWRPRTGPRPGRPISSP